MRIENSDIDCLIDVSVFLKVLADHPEDCRHKKPFKIGMNESVKCISYS